MKTLRNQNYWWKFEQLPLLLYLCKWLFLSVLSGACIGSASALLLVSLEWATQYREHHLWIIALLPVAGLLIGLMYHYWAGTASRGNNYLIEEIRSPHDIIPFRMAPLVYIGTVLTHLFGGSAGREGTGVQMGGAIADQFSRLFRMRRRDHRLMVAIGISAGSLPRTISTKSIPHQTDWWLIGSSTTIRKVRPSRIIPATASI